MNIKADMAAAELLGHDARVCADSSGIEWVGIGGKPYAHFSISRQATRDDVVQALGEKYGINIVYMRQGRVWMADIPDYRVTPISEDRIEVIRAACIEVMK